MKKIIYILLFAAIFTFNLPGNAQHLADSTFGFAITTPGNKQEIASGLETLVRYQEERRAKEKKAAIIRIGIGVAFLAVLVIGLSRRARKK